MTTETWVVLIVLGLAGMAGAFWSARRIDRQQSRASDILSHGTEQQRTADELQRTASELQRREAELLSRWETVVARLEAVAARCELYADAEPGAAADGGGVTAS